MWFKRAKPTLETPPQTDRLTYVIGDIHGCCTELDLLLAMIDEDRAGKTADIVAVGDYVDRGPDPKDVLDRLHSLGTDAMCLLGNHDRMMLKAIIDPQKYMERWLHAGGQSTLHAMGILPEGNTPTERLVQQARAAESLLGMDVLSWLGSRPLWWQSGTLIAVHAYTEPDLPMDQQTEHTLIWGRPPSNQTPRTDSNWVVHGHTMIPEPSVEAGHIAIDTGAFRTGSLTALVCDGGPPRFLST